MRREARDAATGTTGSGSGWGSLGGPAGRMWRGLAGRCLVRPLRTMTAVAEWAAGSRQPAGPAPSAPPAPPAPPAPAPSAGLTEELARVRDQEAERGRLVAMARESGVRIRGHLREEDVLQEARLALEENLDCDHVHLHLVEGDRISPPIGHERDWLFPLEFLDVLDGTFIEVMRSTFHSQASQVIQDVAGPGSYLFPPEVLRTVLDAGIGSLLLVPFGSGRDMFGVIVAVRLRPSRPWTQAEVTALEWIAADLGQGLHLARMYEAQTRRLAELRSADRVRSEFLATVSHELRTPLTSIAGFVEILREGGMGRLNATQEHTLETVERNTERLRTLIDNVLTLSKIESGDFRSAMRPVDVAELATAATAALRPQAAAKHVSLTSACPPRLMVNGDAGQLDRVLMNLLSNAVKFTPEAGTVSLAVTSGEGKARIQVSDTGIGIPEADQKRLFTRFFRASNALGQSTPGTGLGLVIVRSIVANHDGQLELRSREGEGTTVTIRLPLLTAKRERGGEKLAKPSPRPQ